jgi:hypothetical protein
MISNEEGEGHGHDVFLWWAVGAVVCREVFVLAISLTLLNKKMLRENCSVKYV